MQLLIIGTCAFCFVAGVILGGAINRPTVRTVEFDRPSVEVEEIPGEGEACVVIQAPKHRHPITQAIIFDGDTVRLYREVKTI